MVDYEYEIFLSYHRGSRQGSHGGETLSKAGFWVQNVLYPELRQALDQERPGVRIFFDQRIPTGDHWDVAIQQALQRSKCMLAVWSVPYFQSAWCRSEWHSMLERERFLERAGDASKLVYPVVFWDGDHFDQEAKRVQQRRDMKPFSALRPENIGTDRHMEFRMNVQDLCTELCRFVDRAPAWRSDWPLVVVPASESVTIPLLRNG